MTRLARLDLAKWPQFTDFIEKMAETESAALQCLAIAGYPPSCCRSWV